MLFIRAVFYRVHSCSKSSRRLRQDWLSFVHFSWWRNSPFWRLFFPRFYPTRPFGVERLVACFTRGGCLFFMYMCFLFFCCLVCVLHSFVRLFVCVVGWLVLFLLGKDFCLSIPFKMRTKRVWHSFRCCWLVGWFALSCLLVFFVTCWRPRRSFAAVGSSFYGRAAMIAIMVCVCCHVSKVIVGVF